MMEQEQDKPFAREPWQRLLREGDDLPPAATNLRIYTEARRPIRTHPTRWWVPASLAASIVLVVMLVQLQYADLGVDNYTLESDLAIPAEPDVIRPAPAADSEAQATGEEAAAEGETRSLSVAPAAPPDTAERDQGFTNDLPDDEVPPPNVELPMMEQPSTAVVGKPPAREEQEAAELKRNRADAPAPAEQAVAAPRQEEKEAITVTGSRTAVGNLAASKVAAEDTRTPEDWYAEIEALRDAGRVEEADAELKKLEAAHPGWLAKNHPPTP